MRNYSLRLILLWIMALTTQVSLGQTIQYFQHYLDSGSTGPSSMVSMPDGSMYVAGMAQNVGLYPDYYNSWIFKTDEQGSRINAVIFQEDSFDINAYDLYVYGALQDTLILLALKRSREAYNQRNDSLLVLKYSLGLILLERQAYALNPSRAFRTGQSFLLENGLYSAWMSTNDSIHYLLSLHAIDLSQKNMQSLLITSDSLAIPALPDLSFHSLDSLIYVWYSNDHRLYDTVPDYAGHRLFATKFDLDFNFVGHIDTTLQLFNGVMVAQSPDLDHYYLHGISSFADSVPLGTYEQHPRIYRFNGADEVVNCTDILLNEDTISYTGWKTLVATSDAIYSFGYFNVQITIPWQNSRSWLVLAKLDTNLQVEKIRLIGEDYFYMNYAAIATADGGVALTGTWYDYHAGEHVCNVFLLKTDKDLTYSINDQQNVYVNEPLIFPNPATEYFMVEKPAEYNTVSMCLMTTDGKTILRDSWTDCNHRVDLNGVDAGNYFVLFFDKTNLISVQMLLVAE